MNTFENEHPEQTSVIQIWSRFCNPLAHKFVKWKMKSELYKYNCSEQMQFGCSCEYFVINGENKKLTLFEFY